MNTRNRTTRIMTAIAVVINLTIIIFAILR